MLKVLLQKRVGSYDYGARNQKGTMAFKFFIEKLRLFALNTLSPQTSANFTHWDAHDPAFEKSMIFPWGQIDYIFAAESLANISTSKAQHSSATDSGHRPVVCSIPSPMTPEARAAKRTQA